VFATWEISFAAIQEKSPNAAELLLVCGFFDHEDIPEDGKTWYDQHIRIFVKALLMILG